MPVRILGVSGSLRAASYNTAILRAAGELLPPGVQFEVLDYADLPLYNEDIGRPAPVERLADAIRGADALLICTPEYNHSLPGVLKNALDWASRPAYKAPITGKPAGVMSASPGAVGGARAQQHLKNILAASAAPVYASAEVCVGQVGDKVVDGKLVDDRTREFLTRWLAGFVTWVERQS